MNRLLMKPMHTSNPRHLDGCSLFQIIPGTSSNLIKSIRQSSPNFPTDAGGADPDAIGPQRRPIVTCDLVAAVLDTASGDGPLVASGREEDDRALRHRLTVQGYFAADFPPAAPRHLRHNLPVVG